MKYFAHLLYDRKRKYREYLVLISFIYIYIYIRLPHVWLRMEVRWEGILDLGEFSCLQKMLDVLKQIW